MAANTYDRRTAGLSPAVKAVQGQYQAKFDAIAKKLRESWGVLIDEMRNIDGNKKIDPSMTAAVFEEKPLDDLMKSMRLLADGLDRVADELERGKVFSRKIDPGAKFVICPTCRENRLETKIPLAGNVESEGGRYYVSCPECGSAVRVKGPA
jgi:hypothetical protein